jgi:hypothetical protein
MIWLLLGLGVGFLTALGLGLCRTVAKEPEPVVPLDTFALDAFTEDELRELYSVLPPGAALGKVTRKLSEINITR